VPSKDAALAGLVFDDDATNNRTDVYRAGTRVLRLNASGSLEANVTGNLTTGGAVRKVAEVAVTAAQLRTLQTTPVELVPGAQGAVLVFQGMLFSTEITTAFDSVGAGEDIAVRMEDGSGALVSASLDTTTDINFADTGAAVAWLPPLATVISGATFISGAGLYLHNVGAGELASANNNANGNATTTCTIVYLEVQA
jgi:hypothetical protein